MTGILIVSHAGLAEGMKNAAEMICGPAERLDALGLYEGDSLESFSEKVADIVRAYHQEEDCLVVCTDLYAATPYNATLYALATLQIKSVVLTGMNLPLILELISQRADLGFEELAEECTKLARKGERVVDVKEMMRGALND